MVIIYVYKDTVFLYIHTYMSYSSIYMSCPLTCEVQFDVCKIQAPSSQQAIIAWGSAETLDSTRTIFLSSLLKWNSYMHPPQDGFLYIQDLIDSVVVFGPKNEDNSLQSYNIDFWVLCQPVLNQEIPLSRPLALWLSGSVTLEFGFTYYKPFYFSKACSKADL